MWPFSNPKPEPPGIVIRNVLGEQIDFVPAVWDLAGAELSGRNWPHADLSGMSLAGANCEGINLFGARLVPHLIQRSKLAKCGTVIQQCYRRELRKCQS